MLIRYSFICFSLFCCFALSIIFNIFGISRAQASPQDLLNEHEKRFYINALGGISIPLQSHFDIKSKDAATNTQKKMVVNMSKSKMATIECGYKIDYDTSIGLSVDLKPHYKMKIDMPDKAGSFHSKANIQNYMLAFNYNMKKIGDKLQPYFIVGLGISNIKVKPSHFTDVASGIRAIDIPSQHISAFAWQAGIGASFPFNDTISLVANAKIQMAHNVNIKYKKFDTTKLKLVNEKTSQTFGVGELTLGLQLNI